MKKWKLCIGSLALAAALLIGLLPTPVYADSPEENPPVLSKMTDKERAKKPDLDGMTWAAESDSLVLYIDEELTSVAVQVKATGDVWYSNPQQAEADPVASDYNRRQLMSQIGLRYYNDSVQENTMDNYSDSIQYGAFEIQYLTDGVTILYHMGAAGSQRILPEVISVERLEGYAAKLGKSQSKKLLRNYTKMDTAEMKPEDVKENTATYPGLEKHPIYVLRSSVKDYIRDEMAEYLAEAGYTEEDLAFDLEDNGYAKEEKTPWFDVPLTYRLLDDDLVVEVDPDAVAYNTDGYYLVSVSLLPFFGAADTEQEGYIFVPDGCGALINLNNGSKDTYSAKVYGQDVTINSLGAARSEIDQNLTAKMPVFGIKAGDSGWYAVVEDGDAYATVNASVSGNLTSYNSVNASFQYLDYGQSSLSDVVGSNSFQMYSPADFSGRYRLRYAFLQGEDASYSGMARAYREYLIENGVLGERVTGEAVPFYTEVLGAVDKYATLLGVKYRAVTPVTTYAQAAEIVDTLQSGGVQNLNVVYSGWSNGGLHGGPATAISPLSKLNKGGLNQKEFLSRMAQQGVDTFLTLQLQQVYKDGILDGYSPFGNAPKYFDRSTATQPVYFMANGKQDKTQVINLISPVYVGKTAEKVVKKLSGVEAGVNLGTISYNLYTDQLTENYTDRQQAALLNAEASGKLEEAFGKALGENANAYMLGMVSDIINVPLDSNRNPIIDDIVPFYEMVLHGYVEYAGDCLNLSDDYTTTLLKSVESGAGLYFRWIYEDNSVLKETDFDHLYSVNYKAWIDQASKDYQTVNEALGKVQGETIVNHEILSEGVVRVTYEKGTEVLVNYSREPVRVDGVAVAARSFEVVAS